MPAAIPLAAAAVGAAGSVMAAKKGSAGSNKASNAAIASGKLRDNVFNLATGQLRNLSGVNADQVVAGFNPTQTGAFDMIKGNVGMGMGDLDTAIGNAKGYTNGLDPAEIQKFMDPYQQDVINSAMGDIDLMRQRRLGDINSQAEAAGAFGGDRTEVAKALANEDFDRTAASTSANLRSTGYLNAQNAAFQNQGIRMGGNQALAQLIDQRRTAANADSAAMLGVGNQEQAQDQKSKDWIVQRAQLLQNLLASDKGAPGIPQSSPGVDPVSAGIQGLQMGLNTGNSLLDYYRNQPISPVQVTGTRLPVMDSGFQTYPLGG